MGKATLIRECFHLHDSTHRCRRYKINIYSPLTIRQVCRTTQMFQRCNLLFFCSEIDFLYINKGVAEDAIVKGLYIQCPGVKKVRALVALVISQVLLNHKGVFD